MIINWAKQINRVCFFILCFFPLLMPHWISLVVILLIISGFVYLYTSKLWSFQWNYFLPLASILLPYIIWLLFSNDIPKGLGSIQVKLILFLLPLVFAFKALHLNEEDQQKAFRYFCIGASLTVIYTNLVMLFKGFTHPVGFAGADLTFSYRVSLEYYSGLHPTYYCAIVYTAAFISLFQLVHQPLSNLVHRLIAWSTFILGSIGGFAAASRATLFAYLLILFVLLIAKLKNHPKRWLFAGASLFFCVVLLLTPMVQKRLQEMNTANMVAPKGNNDNGTNVRSGILRCDIQLLKEHWLVGVGTGNIQHELNACLGQFDTHVYKAFNYNTHNEYFNMWLTCGIAGLIILLSCLFYPLLKSFQSKNWLHVYFIVFMCISFTTENYLDRQMGVTLFALMQCLFFFKTLKTD